MKQSKNLVVMLSYCKNEEYYNMTKNAIYSLLDSEKNSEEDFAVIVVETENSSNFLFEKFDNVFEKNVYQIFPNIKFNYNQFLNFGFKYAIEFLNLKPEYFIVSNNDVLYTQSWFTIIKKAMESSNLHSASPKDPEYNLHQRFQNDVHLGFRTSYELAGWCIVFNELVFPKIYPFDEKFSFWYQDNDYAMSLLRNGFKHGLVTKSHVKHLGSQSHDLISPEDYTSVTQDLYHTYIKKWG